MLTLNKFTGINNTVPTYRLKPTELTMATNVDIGMDGEITRRAGFTEVTDVCHKNLWQAQGFMLATCSGDLVKTDGTTQTVLQESLGVDRVWYLNLPDGRTAFSNGLINGMTDGTTTTPWGVPLPDSVGAFTEVSGDLFPGTYQWAVTYVRQADGLEGGASYSDSVEVTNGGILLTGLPVRSGYDMNVYLSGHNGEGMYLAGTTMGGSFSYLGTNSSLTLPLATDHMYPMPVGILPALFRGRALVAQGNILWASLPYQWELCDIRRDFKQFSSPITLIQPVDDGVYVGTETELAFLAGDQWDKLEYRSVVNGYTVLGSGVYVDAEYLKPREGGNYRGSAMIVIADGGIVYGYNGGSIWRVTEGVYRTDVTEVAATWRLVNGVPQYVAVPQ
jgi:hypothetical protein